MESEDMINYFIAFCLAGLIAFCITPLVIKLAFRLGAIDTPKDERRIHKKTMPRMGGFAIYIAFIISCLIFLEVNRQMMGIMIGGTLILIMGIVDDIKQIKALPKLLVQILAAVILIYFGITVKSVTIPFVVGDGSLYIKYLGIPLTILWVVGITNAINLIDGLDGLACGICLISALTLFGVSLISARYMTIYLTIILAGACLGFLPFNFNPAKIFMGDTGSQFLGFTLAAISLQGAVKSAAAVAVAVPILALGLPIYDTLFAMVRRKLNNRPIMEADRGHLHHKLLDRGMTQKQVVLTMYTVSGLLGGSSIVAMLVSSKNSFALLVIVCAIIIACAIELDIFKKKAKG
jgi:UDP-GlcNAc:undecaprenyl-phosphate/decaprenyl-phosphate GlcNAc-1-phosphate transferase